MPRRQKAQPLESESLEDRWPREAQTARNLEGLTAEQAGRLEEAIAHYERNTREGFAGDWPYGRLVAIYERSGRLEDAVRVLQRGIEVFAASSTRTPADRRAMVSVFRKRMRLLERQQRQAHMVAKREERTKRP
jgi:tetratricopeptide (TPR) repeat protein